MLDDPFTNPQFTLPNTTNMLSIKKSNILQVSIS